MLQEAQIFRTAQQAENNRCPENEHVVRVETLLGECSR